MKLGVIQNGENWFFQIDTKDPVAVKLDSQDESKTITIGPFTQAQYKEYTGLDELPKVVKLSQDNASNYSVNVNNGYKLSEEIIPVIKRTEPATRLTGTIEPFTPDMKKAGALDDLVLREKHIHPGVPAVKKTTVPLLDWDTDTEFTPATPTNPAIVEKAKAAIANIDTAEAEKELESFSKTRFEPIPHVGKTLEQFEAQARENIIALDKELAEGGRVNVADKYILNCQADLNQLVPFKYGWAWSLYLEACHKHWMPPEFNLEKAGVAFKDGSLKASQKAIITKAWYTDQYHELLLPIQTVLNCYRLITNPECRQYTLRQAFEFSLKKHAWLHLTESLITEPTFATHVIDAKGTKSLNSLRLIDPMFRDRYTLIKDNLKNITGETFSTQGDENVRTFVFELIVAFGYVNYIMLLPGYYQVMNLSNIGLPTEGVSNLFEMMVKDIKAQSENLKRLITSILEENPQVLNEELQTKVIGFFKKAVDIETDIISLCSSDDKDFSSIEHLLHYEVTNLLAPMGIQYPTKRLAPTSNHEWFAEVIRKHNPSVENMTSTTGSTSGGGAALGEWE